MQRTERKPYPAITAYDQDQPPAQTAIPILKDGAFSPVFFCRGSSDNAVILRNIIALLSVYCNTVIYRLIFCSLFYIILDMDSRDNYL